MQNSNNTTFSPKVNRLHLALVTLLILIYASACLFTSGLGSDSNRYIDWARAVESGDIFQLSGNTLSPMGVPVSQWSPGTGTLLAVGHLFLGRWLDENFSALATSGVGFLVFWWAMFHILRRAAGGNLALTVFGLVVTFLGTHAGYYSNVVGSEAITYPVFALLVLWLITPQRWRMVDLLSVGAAAGLLLTIRLQLALYVLPCLLLAWVLAVKSWKTLSRVRAAGGLAVLLLPSAAAILEMGITNRWMTGLFYRPAYSFGSDSFRSLDLANPEFMTILFHPSHGLLIYHPLYGLGFAALVIGIVRADSRLERLIFGGLALIIPTHLYLYASWYGWWLGLGGINFGMRGMAITAVVLVPALVRVVACCHKRHPFFCRSWLWVSFAACFCSYLLLMSEKNLIYTYTAFFQLFLKQAQAVFPTWLLVFFILTFSVVWTFWRKHLEPEQNIRPEHPAELPAILLSATIMNYLLVLVFLKSGLIGRFLDMPSWMAYGIIGLADFLFMSTVAVLALLFKHGRLNFEFSGRTLRTMQWGTVALFVVAFGLFANLAIRTERHIAAGNDPTRTFQRTADFNVEEVKATYLEYLLFPGFIEKKENLWKFLVQHGVAKEHLPYPQSAPITGLNR